jgi:hypothetical protein
MWEALPGFDRQRIAGLYLQSSFRSAASEYVLRTFLAFSHPRRAWLIPAEMNRSSPVL